MKNKKTKEDKDVKGNEDEGKLKPNRTVRSWKRKHIVQKEEG